MAPIGKARNSPGTLLLAGVLAVAAILRIFGLGGSSLWPDEGFTWDLVRRPFIDMYLGTLEDSHPPLFNLLAWAWMRIIGESEFALRLPSALYGITTVYLVYLVGKRLWDNNSGLLAAAILALSGFHIWYSQEFRDYSLLCLTSTLFVYTLVRIDEPAKPGAYLLASASATLLLLSHVYGVFLFVGINLFAGLHGILNWPSARSQTSKWVISQVIAFTIYAYWGWLLFSMRSSAAGWIPELGIYQFFLELGLLFNGPVSAVVMCSLVLIWIARRMRKPTDGSGNTPPIARSDFLVLVWLVFPIAVAVAVSLAIRPIFISRYLILCLPAMCLLVSRALLELYASKTHFKLAAALLLAGQLVSIAYAHYLERDQFREVISEVRSNHQAGDLLLVREFTHPVVNYYWRNPEIDIRFSRNTSEIRPFLEDRDRIWFVQWVNFPRKPTFSLGEQIEDHQVIYVKSVRKVNLFLLSRSEQQF